MTVTSAVWDVTTKLGQCFFLLHSFTDRRFVGFKDEVSNLSMACVLSFFRLFEIPRTIAHQATLSMGFSRQEYWSGLPFSPPGDLPDPGIDPESPELQADSLASEQLIWLLDCIFEYFFELNHNKVLQLWTICCINLCGPEILIYYQVTYWTFLSHSRGTNARSGGC